MIARELISQNIFPILTSDTGAEALQMMQVYHVKHLPIVNNEVLLGVLSEDDILIHHIDDAVGTYRLTHIRPYCYDDEHLFEVMTKLGRYKLTMIPVIDHEEKFLGVITMEYVLQYFSTQFSFSDNGSILVLESQKQDFSLAEIARIAESEDVTILAIFVSHTPDDPKTFITLKLNRQDVTSLKATYERFGYIVSGAYSDAEYQDDMKDRYDALMAYLNI